MPDRGFALLPPVADREPRCAVASALSAADADTETGTTTQQRVRRLPPYKVILHNDDVNSFDHVILTILRLTPLDEVQAVEKTIEAHETGRAVLLVTTQERAELYVEQFASCHLTATCEPDE